MHVKHYAAELDALDKDVSLFVDEEAGHSFRNREIREAWLYLTETFLGVHLGGRVGPEPDSQRKAYLDRTLVMIGPSLSEALDRRTN